MLYLLDNVESEIQDYVNIISNIMGASVEIVNEDIKKLIGTGIFEELLLDVKNIDLYKKVEKNLVELVIDDEERLFIGIPLISSGEFLGCMGIFIFDRINKNRIKENIKSYLIFSKYIGNLISYQLDNSNEKREETIGEVLHSINRPGIIVNDNMELLYINDLALNKLDLPRHYFNKPIKINIETEEENKFLLNIKDSEYLIRGKKIPLVSLLNYGLTMILFDRVQNENILTDKNIYGDKRVSLDYIIGKSYAIRELKEKILRIADTQSTVLISGASGTGKELVARAIHNSSDRRNERFIAVNCSALPESLIESELFGYSKGAFTGANPDGKVGKFELANGGVIFLDEIGDMPLDTQVKLLRILEERRVIPIGSNKPVELDIRIIAATNINLMEKIKEKKFREDLYYRLNVIPLKVPLLKDRYGDIDLFIDKFLNKYNDLFGKNVNTIEEECREILNNYYWPGNVRELQNVIEYLVNISSENGVITKNMLPEYIMYSNIGDGKIENNDYKIIDSDRIRPLREIEIEYIEKVLDIYGRDTHGKKKAADKLGIGIATLYRRLREDY